MISKKIRIGECSKHRTIFQNQIAELQAQIDFKTDINIDQNIRTDNIKEVLRDHLESHKVVAREQLTDKDKITIFNEFDEAIEKQLEKLDSKPKTEKKIDSEALKKIKELAQKESDFYDKHGYYSFWSEELKVQRIKELGGEKSEPEKDRKYPKVVYQLGSDSKEYIALKKKYDKLIEDRLNDWYELENELTLEGKVRVQREKIDKWQGINK